MKKQKNGAETTPTPQIPETEPKSSPAKEPNKGKDFIAQEKAVFESFYGRPKTMLEVSVETGILRANICRYLANWESSGQIKLIRSGFCSISLHKAGRYSTNPIYWQEGGRNES